MINPRVIIRNREDKEYKGIVDVYNNVSENFKSTEEEMSEIYGLLYKEKTILNSQVGNKVSNIVNNRRVIEAEPKSINSIGTPIKVYTVCDDIFKNDNDFNISSVLNHYIWLAPVIDSDNNVSDSVLLYTKENNDSKGNWNVTYDSSYVPLYLMDIFSDESRLSDYIKAKGYTEVIDVKLLDLKLKNIRCLYIKDARGDNYIIPLISDGRALDLANIESEKIYKLNDFINILKGLN